MLKYDFFVWTSQPRSTDHWTAPSVQASGTAVTQNHRDEGSKRPADPLEASPSHLPAQSIDAARLEVTSRVKAPRQGPPHCWSPSLLLIWVRRKKFLLSKCRFTLPRKQWFWNFGLCLLFCLKEETKEILFVWIISLNIYFKLKPRKP